MNLSQLEVLVAIADTGSLTEAAEVVSLTQSAVSYSLSKLEAELGVTLLERGRQGVVITHIGDEVLQYARGILSQIEIIRQVTAKERGLSVGKLRFGCVPTIPGRLLTGIIRDFQNKYPDIEIILFEGTPQELTDWLEKGVIDVGTVITSAKHKLFTPFVHNELKIVVSKNNPLAKQTEVRPEALEAEPFIGPNADYGITSQFPIFQNISLPQTRYAVSTQSTIFAMIREDMGVSLMPEMFIDQDDEYLVALSLVPKLFMDVYLAANIKSPAIEAFLQNTSQWAKEHGYAFDIS